jgi:hypothetical protein
MKVLLAANLNSGNTYIDSLYHTLIKQKIEVTASEDDFWDANKTFNIIHVHWLEGLFNWNIKNITQNDFNKFKFRLESLKNRNTKIIITRHNVYPHYLQDTKLVKKVYDLFYHYVNGIIHLGKFSQEDFKQEHQYLTNTILHSVIPHGNYLNLKNSITKNSARSLLNIPEDRFVFLCFGTFRNRAERDMVLKAFKKLKLSNKTLLCSSWNIQGTNNTLLVKLKRTVFNLISHYKLFNTFVSDDNIQTYLNAADALIVPRVKTLNSGLVYLGLSFGKTIIGPKTGNITEVMEQTHNLIYNPNHIDSLTAAMGKAYTLKDMDLDYKNMVYAREYGDWNVIGKLHFDFYNKILG